MARLLENEQELAGIVESASEGLQSVLANHRGGMAPLEGVRRAGIKQAECHPCLRFRLISRLGPQAFCKDVRLLEHKGAVE